MAGKSEHKELIREAFLILTKKCAQVMQEVQAGRAFPPFSPFLHSIQDTFFPLENMEVSDHVFSACIWLNILQNLCCLFFSSPPLPVLSLTPACLSFPSGRFLMWAGGLRRDLPQMQNICLNLVFTHHLFLCQHFPFSKHTYSPAMEKNPFLDGIIFTDSQIFQVRRDPRGSSPALK